MDRTTFASSAVSWLSGRADVPLATRSAPTDLESQYFNSYPTRFCRGRPLGVLATMSAFDAVCSIPKSFSQLLPNRWFLLPN